MQKRMQYNAHLVTSVPNAHLIFQFQYASLRPVSSKAHYGPNPNLTIVKTLLPPTDFLSGPK